MYWKNYENYVYQEKFTVLDNTKCDYTRIKGLKQFCAGDLSSKPTYTCRVNINLSSTREYLLLKSLEISHLKKKDIGAPLVYQDNKQYFLVGIFNYDSENCDGV